MLWNNDAFIGGHPALDFVNTVEDQDKLREVSRISDWSDFLGWAQASSIFSKEQIQALESDIPEAETCSLLTKVHDLREAEYAVLSSIISGAKMPDVAMRALETDIRAAINNSSLVPEENSYKWVPNMSNPNWVLHVLLLSIENLLRSQDVSRLKECGRCTWMFLDKGRGRGRRWCNMSTCGNRSKSASFRSRKQ